MNRRPRLTVVLLALSCITALATWLHINIQGEQISGTVGNQLLLTYRDVRTTIAMDDLNRLGVIDFDAIHHSSANPAARRQYSGVALNDILAHYGVPITASTTVYITAIDGYQVVITAADLRDTRNVFVALASDGKPLGSKADGGTGPLMIVVRQDTFATRWCKFAVRMDIKDE